MAATLKSILHRLDMPMEKAISILRALDVEDVHEEMLLSDDLIDILLECDDDPNTLERILTERTRKAAAVERKRKRRLKIKQALLKRKAKTAPTKEIKEEPEDIVSQGSLLSDVEWKVEPTSRLDDTERGNVNLHSVFLWDDLEEASLKLLIDPGNAPKELIEDILLLIDALNRAEGGSGITYRNEGQFVASGAEAHL